MNRVPEHINALNFSNLIIMCFQISKISGQCGRKENTDMSNKSRDKHEKMIEQVAATMAIEDMPLTQACYENLRAMASGEKTREQITKEITEKYKKRR